MEVADLVQSSPAETLIQRRMEVHAQRLRSLAENNPKAIADLIGRWMAEDRAERWRLLGPARPALLFPK